MATELNNENPEIGDFSAFDLEAELREFNKLKPWPSGIHSKTLTKRPHLRMVLIAMESGAQMREHHADGTVTLHILQGAIRMNILGQTIDMESGRLLAVNPSIKHDVSALQDCAFLLAISWPAEKDLAGMEHRGRGYGT